MRVKLCGDVVNNGWARLYRMFGFEVCCPKDVRDAVENCPAGEELVFEINSPGGSVYMGFEMYTVIRGFPGKTVAEVQGIAASAASVFMAGCKTVLMSPVANVMIHRAQTGAHGNSTVMKQAKQMLDTIDESILNAYVEKAGGKTDRDTFARLMRSETFMTAQQAIDRGLADGLLEAAGETMLANFTASASGNAAANALPSVDDLLKIAAAAGVKLDAAELPEAEAQAAVNEVQDSAAAAPAASRSVNTSTGENAGEIHQEEDSNMEINTVDDLRQAYPELVGAIEQAAADAATTAERERIHAIRDMALPGAEDITEAAMFTEPISAAEYAVNAVKHAKSKGDAWLKGAEDDAANSGANGVNNAGNPGSAKPDEFMDAIKGVNQTK